MDNSPLDAVLDEKPLRVHPKLAREVGVVGAIVLAQIDYWTTLNREADRNLRDGYHWSYNSYSQWRATNFPFLKERTLQREIRRLEQRGLVKSAFYGGTDRRKWVRVDYAALQELFAHLEPDSTVAGPSSRQPGEMENATMANSNKPDLVGCNTETSARDLAQKSLPQEGIASRNPITAEIEKTREKNEQLARNAREDELTLSCPHGVDLLQRSCDQCVLVDAGRESS